MAVRIAQIQSNVAVGDLCGNTELVRRYAAQAQSEGADVIVFPEMCLCGYPPEDLLLRPRFLDDTFQALDRLSRGWEGSVLMVGFPERRGSNVCNSIAAIQDGRIAAVYRKGLLPNYGVFDEKRYFVPGCEPVVFECRGLRLALTICEDIWNLDWLGRFLSGQQFDAIVNISASPFHAGKIAQRRETVGRCAARFQTPVFYCNLVGGQDELVFDGRSLIADSAGRIIAQAKAFQEDILYADLDKSGQTVSIKTISEIVQDKDDPAAEVYHALVLGTRDYVHKNGFSKAVIGLSGGIDSALTAAIAADALGSENVIGVTMPSRFNLAETRDDACRLAENLGIEFYSLPIESMLNEFNTALSGVPGWNDQGLAYENLQARIRGCMMMSLSNQKGWLVLTTGNKSETAVGYCTLYGDTAGGFAVIKDVPKTLVYQLSGYVNRTAGYERILQSIIDRVPTAELRANQKDSDSLPEYDILDRILQGYIEKEKSPSELIAEGFSAQTVQRVFRLVDLAEYKRRQCPPGIKITPRAFGKDRRMPITNKYIPGCMHEQSGS